MRILIVEDDAALAEQMRQALTEAGVGCDQADL